MHLPVASVLGLHQNGLGIVRALAREKVPVIAIDAEVNTAYAATRYGRKVACPDFRGIGLIEILRQIGEELSTPGVLIPTMDRSVLTLSEHRAQIEPYFRHSLPADEVVQKLMSKAATQKYAQTHGFLMPRTFEVRNEKDLAACLHGEANVSPQSSVLITHHSSVSPQSSPLRFPCILKPQVKTVAFVQHAPNKAFLIDSPEELRRTYRLIGQWEPQVVIQEWIPGPDPNLVFCLYYFNAEGEPVAWFTGRKIRQFIPYCGTACSAEPWEDPFVRDAGIRFFQKANYCGFAAIEFKIDARDSRYYLTEPTVGRTEHLFALAAANGVNLPYIGYCDMAGLPVPSWVRSSRPVKYYYWKRDFRAARFYLRNGDLTIKEWLTSLRGKKQYALWAWDDPKPWLVSVTMPIMRKPQKVVRKALNLTQSAFEVVYHIKARRRIQKQPVEGANAVHVAAALDWLRAAHDATGRRGISRGYTVKATGTYPVGWQPAYPEATGYIIPTFFDCASRVPATDLRERAIQMADWEISVQLPNGGIPGGTVGETQSPVVFNTGQVLFGWCRAYRETQNTAYRDAAQQAADFLMNVQSDDGSWHRFTNRQGDLRAHAYDVRVAWALLETFRIVEDEAIREAAVWNLEFTLTLQQPNGWYRLNDLSQKRNRYPLTHTIAYATRGLLESGLLLNDFRYIEAAKKAADAVLERLEPDGYLAGRFYANWKPAAWWSCLTGNAQMVIIWLKLYRLTEEKRYFDAARRALRFLKATQDTTSDNPGVRGGIAGSYPIRSVYGRCQYLSWAVKFFVEALMLVMSNE